MHDDMESSGVSMFMISLLIGGVMFFAGHNGFFDGMFNRQIVASIAVQERIVSGQ